MGLLVLTAAALIVLFAWDSQLFKLAVLMVKVDLSAFGGGFASVPLLFHEVVSVRSWLDAPTLMHGIALGQITPGPIVITATFVGYLVRGPLGGIIATAGVFWPSFLVVVGIAPYYDKLRASPWFHQAIDGILCSFAGLLLSVTVRFAINVSWDLPRILLAAAGLIALRLEVNILWVVLAGTVISVIVF
jgi:chromate transporter